MVQALEAVQGQGVIGIIHGDSGSVDSVAFSPDGRVLTTRGYDGTVRLGDVATRRQLGPHVSPGGNVLGQAVPEV
jgi:WD40 repeat protein